MMKKTSKISNIAIALLTGLAIMLFVLLGILFPTFIYQLNVPDTHAIALWQKQIGEKSLLHISPFFDYQFSSIELKIESNQGFSETPDSFGVFKGYVAQGFEWGEDVVTAEQLSEIIKNNNGSDIANGSLISYNDTVYLISDGKVRSILSPEIFLQMGFKWESVTKVDGNVFNSFEKGDDINFSSLHPNGTLFAAGSDLFFVMNEQKRAVSAELVELIPDSIEPIGLDSHELAGIGNCLVSKRTESMIKCSFEPQQSSKISGNDYIFEIPAQVYSAIEQGNITFNTLKGMREDIARSSLSRIKTSLITRYFPEILN
jgi:hypothetical protein